MEDRAGQEHLMTERRSGFWVEREQEVEDMRRKLKERLNIDDVNLLEYFAAGKLLTILMGADWASRKLVLRPDDVDPWMLNGDDEWLRRNPMDNDVRRIVHSVRTIRLADALYTLVKAGSAGEHIKKRLSTRPIRSTFVEMEIASFLVVNGFKVAVKQETGKRGEDYDIEVSNEQQTVSVEVTSKEGGVLSEKTIMNTLFAKRDQVPPDKPAVLCLHVPACWMRHAYQKDIFSRALNRFYGKSKRFNSVVLVSEEVIPQGNGGIPRLVVQATFNEVARHRLLNREIFGASREINGRSRMAFSYFARIQARGEDTSM